MLNFKQVVDKRGVLGVIDDKMTGFPIKRVFWITNVPAGATRGHHAHKECQQVIICLLGSFTVWLDGVPQDLHDDYPALEVKTGVNVILGNFTNNAVCLVLCSEYYQEDDYIR